MNRTILISLSVTCSVFAAEISDLTWFRGGHSGSVNTVAYSPDGTILASGSDDRTIKLWQISSGELIRTLVEHTGPVESLAFSPTGEQLLSGAERDGDALLWLLATGRPVQRFSSGRHGVLAVAFAPEGGTIALGAGDLLLSRNYEVQIWSTEGVRLASVMQNGGPVTAVTFSPDGSTLASSAWDGSFPNNFGRIDIWQPAQLERLTAIFDESPIQTIAFSPDGTLLGSGNNSADSAVKLWDTRDGTLVRVMNGSRSARSVAFSPEGELLASAGVNSNIYLWRVSDGELIQSFRAGSSPVDSVRFHSDGTTLASGSGYPQFAVKLWQVPDGKPIRQLTWHVSTVASLSFDFDQQIVASAAEFDPLIRLWSVAEGSPIATLSGHSIGVNAARISPDGRRLASGSRDTMVKMWNLSDGTVLWSQPAHTDGVFGLAFSPDGDLVATGGFFEDGAIKLWRAADGSLVRRILDFPGSPFGPFLPIVFSPDGTLIASIQEGVDIYVWRVSDGVLVHHFRQIGLPVTSLAISPDGSLLASGGVQSIHLWEISTGNLRRVLPGSGRSVDFSPDGRILLAGGRRLREPGGVLDFWRVADGAILEEYDQETGPAFSGGPSAVLFSSDGCSFAYGRSDATLVMARTPPIVTGDPGCAEK